MEKDSICTIKINAASCDHAPIKMVITSFTLSNILLSYGVQKASFICLSLLMFVLSLPIHLLLPLALQPAVGFSLSNNIFHFPLFNFRNNKFLLCGVVSPTPNPPPGGPGYPFLSGWSPLTCLAWEALPVAYATASIALGIM
jgi:hypothetical protein